MSAIAGIVSFDGSRIEPESISRMVAAMKDRGTATLRALDDGSAIFALVGRSPADIGGTSPLQLTGRLLLTTDARIDNREELRALYRLAAESTGDAALLGALWREAGRDGLARIAGDFTMALWDADARTLTCARDHFGVRPFYYHANRRRLFFATEIGALLALPEIPATVDEESIACFLGGLPRPPETTYYREIRRLPAAHLMRGGADGVVLERYWDLDPEREISYNTQEEYDEGFRRHFIEAVSCRFDGGARTGAMLSGGLDSSSITAVARGIAAGRGERLRTYSIIFPTYPLCDESRWIESVVDGGSIDPTWIEGDRIAPLAGLGETLDHLHEPLDAPNLFLHAAIYRHARLDGLSSVLDGLDGDTTVSHGVAWLAELASAGRFGRLWSEVSALSRNNGQRPGGILWRRGLKPLLPEGVRGLKRRLRPSDQPAGTLVPDREFARRTGYRELIDAEFEKNLSAPIDSRKHHYRKLTSTLMAEVLEIADRAAGRHAVEPRYPFFDRRLVEYCLALPGEQKLQAGWTRFILRNALGGILPESIRWRPGKANLGHNFIPSLLRHEAEAIAAMVDAPGDLACYIDPGSLEQAWKRYRAAPSNDDSSILWKALALDHWLKTLGTGVGGSE